MKRTQSRIRNFQIAIEFLLSCLDSDSDSDSDSGKVSFVLTVPKTPKTLTLTLTLTLTRTRAASKAPLSLSLPLPPRCHRTTKTLLSLSLPLLFHKSSTKTTTPRRISTRLSSPAPLLLRKVKKPHLSPNSRRFYCISAKISARFLLISVQRCLFASKSVAFRVFFSFW